ncbi:MAG: hypothetical protein HY042_03905 [Spirochaetia bacterium]|nr:hypothetical protein [Spirochaetia bacterium]
MSDTRIVSGMDVTTKALGVAAAAALFCALGSLQASEGIVGSQVKAQIWAEQGLRQNDYYLKTLNAAVSNYGTATQKAAFKRAVNHQVQAKIHFLSFKFDVAYDEVRRSQYLMIQLYEDIVETSRETTQGRVIRYADKIVHSRNVKLKKYLTLGLRALEGSRLKVLNEYNMRPWLFVMRLDNLADAMKLTREAERYAMLITIDFESIWEV